jgi:hypothetical protein
MALPGRDVAGGDVGDQAGFEGGYGVLPPVQGVPGGDGLGVGVGVGQGP